MISIIQHQLSTTEEIYNIQPHSPEHTTDTKFHSNDSRCNQPQQLGGEFEHKKLQFWPYRLSINPRFEYFEAFSQEVKLLPNLKKERWMRDQGPTATIFTSGREREEIDHLWYENEEEIESKEGGNLSHGMGHTGGKGWV